MKYLNIKKALEAWRGLQPLTEIDRDTADKLYGACGTV